MENVFTEENLKLLYNRVKQVFIAKKDYKPDNIELLSNGSFYCSYTYGVSYGGEETVSLCIAPEDLTADLDVLITEREKQEEIDRLKLEKQRQYYEKREKDRKLKERKQQYLKLKKEFGD